jgi:hypothetical protein
MAIITDLQENKMQHSNTWLDQLLHINAESASPQNSLLLFLLQKAATQLFFTNIEQTFFFLSDRQDKIGQSLNA